MEVKFSKHAKEKLEDSISKKLGVTANLIQSTLSAPEIIDNSEYPVLMAVGKLTKDLTLCIVYKFTEKGVRVITFFPARRGRYEGKILYRR